jgi:hypothetical protein
VGLHILVGRLLLIADHLTRLPGRTLWPMDAASPQKPIA